MIFSVFLKWRVLKYREKDEKIIFAKWGRLLLAHYHVVTGVAMSSRTCSQENKRWKFPAASAGTALGCPHTIRHWIVVSNKPLPIAHGCLCVLLLLANLFIITLIRRPRWLLSANSGRAGNQRRCRRANTVISYLWPYVVDKNISNFKINKKINSVSVFFYC